MWEGETVVRRCDSSQGGVKSKDRCVMEEVNIGLGRCDSYQGV